MNKTCVDCDQPAYCRKRCRKHYNLHRTHSAWNTPGAALNAAYRAKDWKEILNVLEEWSFKEDGCWIWPTGQTKTGYRRLTLSGSDRESGLRNTLVHRVAFQAANAGEMASESVHHKCANRACCNPDHLEAISQRENMAEMHERQFYKKRIQELEAENARLRKALHKYEA